MRDIEKYTEVYNESDFEEYQVKYRRQKVLAIMETYKPKEILEIGCGREPLFQFIEHSFVSYVCIEPSKLFYENAAELARVLSGRQNGQIFCYNEFFSATDRLKEGHYDFIICSSLLHEVEKPRELLENIKCICDAGSIVHINVPNALSIHRILAKESQMIDNVYTISKRNIELQQNTVFDMKSLKTYVMETGFSVIEEGSYFVKPFSHSQMFQMLKNRIIDEKVLDGLYKLAEYIPQYGSEIYVNCICR